MLRWPTIFAGNIIVQTNCLHFQQLKFLNERYENTWFSRAEHKIFEFLHGTDSRMKMMKDNFISRVIRASFSEFKREKFLGYGDDEFYNSSERSRMVCDAQYG